MRGENTAAHLMPASTWYTRCRMRGFPVTGEMPCKQTQAVAGCTICPVQVRPPALRGWLLKV
jgi:hypothetical protein